MGEAVEELSEAFARAERAYRNGLAQIEERHLQTAARDLLRKRSPNSHGGALEGEQLALWEWHRANQAGFDRLSFAQQLDEILDITGPRGVDGFTAYLEAGVVLLNWFSWAGKRVTATKFGSGKDDDADASGVSYAYSPAVRFLAEQFRLLNPSLDAFDSARPGWSRAADVGYRVARRYLSDRKPG